jgi:hypothetical protein
MVIIGAVAPGDADYLINYFGEATERGTDIESIPCRDARNAIDIFGNLMSSAVIYGDTLECQALLEGLRGVRMVQGRGNFRVASTTKVSKDESAFVSNIPPGETILYQLDVITPRLA